jgi:hypothetical protein
MIVPNAAFRRRLIYATARMASLDSLPADQRAVIQLVLQQGRGFDDIAKLLGIDRAAVRERALAAFDALGPQSRVPAQRRALITDYLLGQLPPRLSEDTRERLAESAGERAWARVVASELAPIAGDRLPEIPAPARDVPPVATGAPERPRARTERQIPPDYGLREPRPPAPPSSRRGGAILLAAGAIVVVAVVLILVLSGGSSKKHKAATTAASTTQTSSTPTTGTSAQLVAQVNLLSPTGSKKTAGVAQVVRQGANSGLVIVAQGVPPNTTHDAYAVWLYNSPSDSRILGFVNPGVKQDGKLQTAGVLPADASHFKQLLVTLETQAKPHGPGKIVLEGALSLA